MIRLKSLRLGNAIIYRGDLMPYANLYRDKPSFPSPRMLLDNTLFAHLLTKYDDYIGKDGSNGEVGAIRIGVSDFENLGFQRISCDNIFKPVSYYLGQRYPPFTVLEFMYKQKGVYIKHTLTTDYNSSWSSKYEIGCLLDSHGTGIVIEYLHHLQNIYYSLTWTDLAVDLERLSQNGG